MSNSNELKKRVRNLFFIGLILFFVGVCYYVFYINFPRHALKCVLFEITGLKCPGCGITRMLSSFIQFDFIKGIKYNLFLGVTLPLVGYIVLYSCYLYVYDKKSGKTFNIFCIVYLVLLLIWMVVRNIIGV